MPRLRLGACMRNSRLPYVLLSLFVIAGSLLAFPRVAQAATASDNFQRANGSLGPNWTASAYGGLTISGNVAVGAAAGNSGDLWTANTFGSDQFSQVTTSSTQLTGGKWLGVQVRGQNSGQSGYVGIYKWNNGSPVIQLFLLKNSAWTQLGSTYSLTSSGLAAGSTLSLSVAGASLSLSVNGTVVATATSTTLTGGAPGLITYGAATAAAWTGGDGTGPRSPPPSTYSVGGTLSGLTSGTVVLQDNGGDNLSVSATGPFTFATKLASGAAYSVTVQSSPSGQACTVASGSGTVASANITSVAVTCAPVTYSVGGTVSGLNGTVTLQDNGGDSLSVAASGSFTFATKLASGASYSVTVQSSPSGQSCTVASGSGTIAAANVTSVAVTCANVATGAASAADNFQRANGALGPNWTATSDGGLTISGNVAVGAAAGNSADLWTANTFGSDQFSQVTTSSTQLTGGKWLGVDVRGQNSGQDGYVGIYKWNNGSPLIQLFLRKAGLVDAAGQHIHAHQQRAGGGFHPQAVGDGRHLVAVGERHRSGDRDQHDAHRRRAGHHHLRGRHRRELDRRHGHLLRRRHRLRPGVRHAGPEGQRQRHPQRDR